MAGKNDFFDSLMAEVGLLPELDPGRPEACRDFIGDFVGIHVNTLDDASVDELMSGPLGFVDGRHDNWGAPPADTRHL